MKFEICIWCKSPDAIEWRRMSISTGFKIEAWCLDCGKPAKPGNFAPKPAFLPNEIEAMPWTEASNKAKCPVCRTHAHLECHHLAPREFFGNECDLWPTVEVCRTCHERWHLKMGQPISIAEAAEE